MSEKSFVLLFEINPNDVVSGTLVVPEKINLST